MVQPTPTPTPIPSRGSRPDIRALGAHGSKDLIDVTLTHPLTDFATRSTPETFLRSNAAIKRAKHADYAKSMHGGRVVPFVVIVTGGWRE